MRLHWPSVLAFLALIVVIGFVFGETSEVRHGRELIKNARTTTFAKYIENVLYKHEPAMQFFEAADGRWDAEKIEMVEGEGGFSFRDASNPQHIVLMAPSMLSNVDRRLDDGAPLSGKLTVNFAEDCLRKNGDQYFYKETHDKPCLELTIKAE